jgi:Na+/proline symporter
LWGVVVTDFLQFTFAMIGTTALAWFALRLPQIGGLDGLVAQLPAGTLDFVPAFDGGVSATTLVALPLASFLTYVTVQWWASWYPGQEPGGGGYVAQRMMSAKDERHSLFATLWFTVAHYCVRPWPWIIVGLVSMVLYPTIVDKEAGYAMVIRDHLPPGWRGLLLGAFFAAYMSTISSQLNWGTSYIVNDWYRRFLKRDASERHYVWISRLTTIALMIVSGIVTFYLESIRQAWEFVLESGAGIGLVLILRWYWWRINAWSEISAMIAAAIGYAAIKTFTDLIFPYTLLAVVGWTTICWVIVTFATPPESDEHLVAFYRRTHPDGPGWERIARLAGKPQPRALGGLFLNWIAGVTLVYAALFAVGNLLLGSMPTALGCVALAGASVAVLVRTGWHE